MGNKTLAIEYEIPQSHTFKEIVEKMKRSKKKHDKTIFVCQQKNYKEIVKAVGKENTFCRGISLAKNIIQTSTTLVEKNQSKQFNTLFFNRPLKNQ